MYVKKIPMLHWHSVQCYEKLFLGAEDIMNLCTSRILKKLQNCWQKLVFKIPCIELDFSTLFAWWASLSGKSAFILISSCVVKEKKKLQALNFEMIFFKRSFGSDMHTSFNGFLTQDTNRHAIFQCNLQIYCKK